MTSQADAIKAVRLFKVTQRELDAMKDTTNANMAAKKIIIAFMTERKVNLFKGVTLKVVPRMAWNNVKLRVFLGDKVDEFRQLQDSNYLGLAKRASQ